jgi:sugar lactone lactonase YvrE
MALDPGSANCVDAAAGTTCTLALQLNPGSYTGSLVTYDGPLDGSKKPTGKVLSKNQSFSMDVLRGKANVPKITLSGVPAGIQLFILSPRLRLVTNSPIFLLPALLVAGQNTVARFAVYATDPDGNVIFGPGAPTFAVSAGGGFSTTIAGSTVRLAVPSPAVTNIATMTFVASSTACASPAACTWKVDVGFDSLLAIADAGNEDVVVQTAGSNPAAPVVATVSTGVNGPIDVKFDAFGNLFVANYSGSTVTEYAPPYTGAPIATISNGVAGPNQIALAADGTLAVVNAGAGNVTAYAPPYANQTPVTIATPSFSAAFDPTGNLWIGTTSSGIVRYAPPFSTSSATASNGVSSPFGIAFDSAGNLYVANHGNDTIEKFALGSYAAPAASASMAGVSSIATANVFIVACGTNVANVYGSSLDTPLADPAGTTPCRAAFDRQFGLWLTLPDDKLVVDYVYPPGVGGYFVQGAGLNHPVAIASFPGAPP